MEVAKYLEEVGSEINFGITESLPELFELVGVVPTARQALMRSLLGGKGLRGMLTCLVCEALGGKRGEAIPRAVAMEYIHAATLVHDDIIDEDHQRRGQPAIWTIDGVGTGGAILIGDLLQIFGARMLWKLTTEDADVGAWAILRVTNGAFKEFFCPTSSDSDEVINLKTGALFGASCKLGAFAAGAIEFSQSAYHYGERCGEAFQVADDLHDATGRMDKEEAEQVIEQKIFGTVRTIDGFPENEYTKMLRQVPGYIVDMMRRESQ